MMTVMIMTEADKTKKVADPCVGTGIFLLHVSNFSLRLYGQDISLDMCKETPPPWRSDS
jgi:tRNA G10  N-methylase Trm11